MARGLLGASRLRKPPCTALTYYYSWGNASVGSFFWRGFWFAMTNWLSGGVDLKLRCSKICELPIDRSLKPCEPLESEGGSCYATPTSCIGVCCFWGWATELLLDERGEMTFWLFYDSPDLRAELKIPPSTYSYGT